jgi:hypothetical protein
MNEQLFDTIINAYVEDTKYIHNFHKVSGVPFSGEKSYEIVKLIDTSGTTDVAEYCVLTQLQAFCKKFVGKSSFDTIHTDDQRDANALGSFLDGNIKCKATNGHIASISKLADTPENNFFSEVEYLLFKWFESSVGCTVNFSAIASNLRHGPGSSVGGDSDDFVSKVGSNNHTMSSVGLQRFTDHLKAETDRSYAETELFRLFHQHGKDSVKPSSTTPVPKNVETGRTVCTEPSVNMENQLATGALLEEVLAHVGINLSTQPDINRLMAQFGSTKAGSHYVTLDLRNASNLLSIEFCRRVLPPSWFDWLMFIRSDRTRLPDGSKQGIPLEMMSSMGNGFTFPLQTLLFAAIIHVSYEKLGMRTYTRRSALERSFGSHATKGYIRYCVFGDDMIFDSEAFDEICQALEWAGFEINHRKTYQDGPFRESCGQDWLNGFPVRPVFVDKLDKVQERISLINRLIRWSAMTSICLPKTVSVLMDSIPNQDKVFVPMWEADDAGIQIPFELAKHCVQLKRLQTPTLRRLTGAQQGSFVYKKFEVRKVTNNFWFVKGKSYKVPYSKVSYIECLTKPSLPLSVNSRGDVVKICNAVLPGVETYYTQQATIHCKSGPINWGAVHLGLLGGYVRNLGVTLRQREVTYKDSVFGVAPGWDAPFDTARFSGWRGTSGAWLASAKYHMVTAVSAFG